MFFSRHRTAGVRTSRLKKLPTAVAEFCRAVDADDGHVELDRVNRLTWCVITTVTDEHHNELPPVGVWFTSPPRHGGMFFWRVPVEPLREDFRYRGLSRGRDGRIRSDYPIPYGRRDPHGSILEAF